MMTKKSTHVISNSDGGWHIKQSGGQRSSGHFETKQEKTFKDQAD